MAVAAASITSGNKQAADQTIVRMSDASQKVTGHFKEMKERKEGVFKRESERESVSSYLARHFSPTPPFPSHLWLLLLRFILLLQLKLLLLLQLQLLQLQL